ncbi:unnamed protein product [Leuciscus chuanchicus]
MAVMEARVSQPVCHHLHNVAVLYISLQPPGSIAVLHQMLPFSTSSWFTPPSCSKPAGYFCSICLLPPREQLTLQQLYDKWRISKSEGERQENVRETGEDSEENRQYVGTNVTWGEKRCSK